MFKIEDYFAKINVLDHGHVELFDGMWMDPRLKIVNSARVSFAKESKELTDKDLKLIQYLKDHEHFSTFRHSYFSFRIKAPIIVFRQWWKYQIGSNWEELENTGSIIITDTSWNEASGRYQEFKPEFYIPNEIRIQSKDNKQGSFGSLDTLPNGENCLDFFKKSCEESYERYKYLISANVAKEQARCLLPQNIYSECIWTCSVQTIIYFLHQRLKQDAQFEIREYAKAILALVKPIFTPLVLTDQQD